MPKQSKFHNLVEAGSMIHIWGGENSPDPKAIFDLIKTTWDKTKCVQWVLSPEYTLCKDCNTRHNGLLDKCPKCGSENVRGVTRITGYYVFIDKFSVASVIKISDLFIYCIRKSFVRNLKFKNCWSFFISGIISRESHLKPMFFKIGLKFYQTFRCCCLL